MEHKSHYIKTALLAGCFLLAGIIIVYSYPPKSKFPYAFDRGSTWQYEDLSAPFSFPIMKSDAEYQSETDSVKKEFIPYFQRNDSLLIESLNKLNHSFNQETDSASILYRQYISKSLISAYTTGIISTDEMASLQKEGKSSIYVINPDKLAKETNIKQLYSAKEVYEKTIENAPAYLNKSTLRDYNLNNYIKENVTRDDETSGKMEEETLRSVSRYKGRVQSGEIIIKKGEIIRESEYDKLRSFKIAMLEGEEDGSSLPVRLGQILLVASILCAFYLYLVLFRKNFAREIKNVFFMLSMIVVLCVLTSLAIKNKISPFVVPYAIIPIVVTTFFDARTGLFTHLTAVLLSSFVVPNEFEFLFIQVIVGMISICTLSNIYLRSQLVKSALLIVLTYCILYIGNTLVKGTSWNEFDATTFAYFAVNGVLLLFANPLIYILEKLFGFMSDMSLVELANTNNELLRKFSEVAPGSFQHSMQVSNLASEAASRIGANPMLARTGALYHDIGKMNNPAFFTENQSSINPHTELNDEEKSAQIIIRHVTDGLAIAKKEGLPDKIQEFIRSHHGRSKTKYFYYTMKNKYPDREIDEELFTYPGPRPTTMETAILSMCDSVEAASRSLKEYTDKSINDLVEKIVNDQVQDGLFEDAPITFHQIGQVKQVLKGKLKTIYHTRVSYPELKNNQLTDKEEAPV